MSCPICFSHFSTRECYLDIIISKCSFCNYQTPIYKENGEIEWHTPKLELVLMTSIKIPIYERTFSKVNHSFSGLRIRGHLPWAYYPCRVNNCTNPEHKWIKRPSERNRLELKPYTKELAKELFYEINSFEE